ncbi:MAG TPA: TetR/AcrR family transcriptional regulator [Chlamydiales bacterium]|nr:TetR/AcrR family transcriptional regulator [Chlamydiales bacterium]
MQDLSLREKKFIKVKWALVDAFIERLKKTKFDQISIKDVCLEAEVSEATFYNYFPKKIDVIFNYLAAQILKLKWKIHTDKKRNPIQKIDSIFESIANYLKQPYLLIEMVSAISQYKLHKKPLINLNSAEKRILCPDFPGIEDVSIVTIKEIIKDLIEEAKISKLIISEISSEDLSLVLHSILVGTPFTLGELGFKDLVEKYKLHLSIIWDRLT